MPLKSDEPGLELRAVRTCSVHPFEVSTVKTAWTNVLAKCQAFWNKQRKSTIAQDIVKERLGKLLPVPNATRWNSKYDAMQAVVWYYVERRRTAVRTVCEKPLTAQEVQFLQEYVKVSELCLGEFNPLCVRIFQLSGPLCNLLFFFSVVLASNLVQLGFGSFSFNFSNLCIALVYCRGY